LRRTGFGLLLVLAACSEADDGRASGGSGDAVSPASGAGSGDRAGSSDPRPYAGAGLSLPPAGAAPRYAGRWAERAELCRGGAWIFTPEKLDSPGGVSCEFNEMVEAAGGYDIAARCTDRTGTLADRFTLRFAESARAMLIEGSAILPDTGLVHCGPQ